MSKRVAIVYEPTYTTADTPPTRYCPCAICAGRMDPVAGAVHFGPPPPLRVTLYEPTFALTPQGEVAR